MYEEITVEAILDLEEELNNELLEISNWDKDIEETKDYLMYKILLFILQNRRNEDIIHNFCWKYYDKTKKEINQKIP